MIIDRLRVNPKTGLEDTLIFCNDALKGSTPFAGGALRDFIFGMKTKKWILMPMISFSLIFGFAINAAADVAVGETRESVFDTLGEPEGYAGTEQLEAYTFDRGRVVFREGRVVSYEIVSQDEARQLRQEAQHLRQERMREGIELRDQMLDDEMLAKAPARERLARWQAFHKKYPQVDVGLEPVVAAQQFEMEQIEELRQIELQVLEARKMAALATEYYAPPAPHYAGGGLPLVYDAWHHRGGFTDKFIMDDPYRMRVSVTAPPPPPPTPRERFMPLQERPIRTPSMVVVPQPKHKHHHSKAVHRGPHRTDGGRHSTDR